MSTMPPDRLQSLLRQPALAVLTLVLIQALAACGGAALPVAGADAARHERVVVMADGYAAGWPQLPKVDAAALHAGALDEPVLVDCREAFEQDVSVLPDAVTRSDYEAQVAADPGAFGDRPVVVYCTIGYRSGEYAATLRQRGVDAYNLHGGVLDWAHAGGGFVTPRGDATRAVHVYGHRWSLLPAGYDAAY